MSSPGADWGEAEWVGYSLSPPLNNMAKPISRAARALIVRRLSDPSSGFNPLLNQALADSDISPNIGAKLPIDFSPISINFFEAHISPERLDQTTDYTLPYLTLFTIGIENLNLEKFWTFSGKATLGLNVFWGWEASGAPRDMEIMGDCCEEALMQVFNAPAIADWSLFDTVDGLDIIYNGDLRFERTEVQVGGENFQQALIGTMGMDIHVR